MGLNVLGLPKKALSGLAATIRAIKALRGEPDGLVGTDSDGKATTSHLGSGTPSSTVFLRGDGTWATASGAALANGDYGDILVSTTTTPGDTMTVESAANTIFLPATSSGTQINAALASLSGGGIVMLAPGTYHITTPILLEDPGVTLRGSGITSTLIWYDASANNDIITIAHTACTVEDLSVYGANPSTATNGSGQVGTGCGIKIAQPSSGSGGPSWDYCGDPTIRRVGVYCTPSWSICDIGIATPANFSTDGNFTYPTSTTNKTVSVHMKIEDVTLAFANSGGALYIGSGASAALVTRLKTNSYSYGTHTRITASASPVAVDRGAVHLYNTQQVTFEGKCVFQSPSAQSAGTAVDHYDNDATMLSLQHANSTRFLSPYFEVLSANCAGTHPDGGSPAGTNVAGRTHWFITSINSNWTYMDHPYFRSAVENPGATDDGYALRIMETPADGEVGNGITIRGGIAYQFRQWYSTALGRAPSDPYDEGDFVTWDRDDFCFRAGIDGQVKTPINIEDFVVTNVETGAMREATTPASPTAGFSIVYQPAARFSTNNRNIRLGHWEDNDLTGTVSSMDDIRVRSQLSHFLGIGTMGYSAGNGTADGAIQREGLWVVSRGNDFRLIPFMRKHTTAESTLYAGDLWMQFSGAAAGTPSVYPNAAFQWYSASAWRYVVGSNAVLTSGRVPFATTSGYLTDDADFTFATDTLTVTKIAATQFTGDTQFTGSGVGWPYGSCYGNEIGWTQAAAAQNTWYLVSDADMADGQLNNVTHDGSGKLTVTIAGRYLVNFATSIEANSANHHLQAGVAVNGTAANDGIGHSILTNAGDEVTIAGSAILSLAANDTVEINVRTVTAGAPDISVDHANLTVVQIGG